MKRISAILFLLCQQMGARVHAQARIYPNEFPLHDVVLLEGPFKRARDLNIGTLLQYHVDRLMASYRKEAGLTPKDSSYTNWDGLDGHIAGHYLSAMAINAGTGSAECRRRLEYMIGELKVCQEANTGRHASWGVGYAGGVPNSEAVWLSVRNGDFKAFHAAWVPWYNVHKMYAGLRDAWVYTGNEDAKKIFLRFCDWAVNITAGLTEEQMQAMLDTEQGGMNEIMADAYQISGERKYLDAARRFSHRMLLDAMARGVDNLDNKHANTQVPKAIGFARIGEVGGDSTYLGAGQFFWETVTGKRSLAFGGNSRREFFPSAAACIDFVNDVEGPESCNSANMLKLTEDLFRDRPSARYADYYERTMLNHILSTQDPETGGYVYFTPVRPRSYRVYSSPNKAMWCCVGTGMENHGKYNQFIYTHAHDSLYVNLFVASALHWKEKGMRVRQETAFPYAERSRLTIVEGDAVFPLMIRYPWWVAKGALTLTVNGKAIRFDAEPSSYVAVNRRWRKGDVVEIGFPMRNTIERLPNVPAYIAILHGPVLLGAKTGTEDMKGLIADDSRWGHIASGAKLPIDKAPIFIEDDVETIAQRLIPVKGSPLHFTLPGVKTIHASYTELQPFFKIHDARYMIYWMALSNEEYRVYLDSLSGAEKERLALERRTVSSVAPGEQQPEVDHAMQGEKTRKGTAQDHLFREAFDEGYFSYRLTTDKETKLSLLVRYWGAEWGNRNFEIYIDDQKLVTENNTGRWNQSRFYDIKYNIPAAMLEGKEAVRVKFKALKGASTSPVYYVRLINTLQQPE